MSFISVTFLVFFIAFIALYYTAFKQSQWLLMLLGSLVFYAFASPVYLIFLLLSSITTYAASLAISTQKKKAKLIFALTIAVNLLVLIIVKYSALILESFGIGELSFKMIVPLGISYYTFIVIGYLTDVYREIILPQESFLKYLCFVSFFPHITQGPISRYGDLSGQLFVSHRVEYEKIREGVFRIILGLFKKLIIAQRLTVYVDRVYGNYSSYDGLTLLCATVFYAILIYCDFSGYMDIVVGISRLLGINIAENFNLPYFAASIPEFWRRWHITLGSFFKDYLYYPLLRSSLFKKLTKAMKKGKIKFSKAAIRTVPTVIALLITWMTTGIWHGASYHYGFWGLYHGILISLSTITAGKIALILKKLNISDDSLGLRIFRIIKTFALVDIGYVFFRAPSTSEAFGILGKIVTDFHINGGSIAKAILPFTEDNTAISYASICFAAILVLVIYEFRLFVKELKEITPETSEREAFGCYLFEGVMIAAIILFGVFGQSSFIYMMY